MLRHDSFEDCPLTFILSPEGERKLPSPLLRKGEGVPAVACRLAEAGQGEGSFCSPIIPHQMKVVVALMETIRQIWCLTRWTGRT